MGNESVLMGTSVLSIESQIFFAYLAMCGIQREVFMIIIFLLNTGYAGKSVGNRPCSVVAQGHKV